MNAKIRIASGLAILLAGCMIVGCHQQPKSPGDNHSTADKQAPEQLTPLPVNPTAEVTVSNRPQDAFFKAVSSRDDRVTPDRVQQYAQDRIVQYLKLAGIEADVKTTLHLAIGVGGQMLKDPTEDPKGLLLHVDGNLANQVPHIDIKFSASQQANEILKTAFSGGDFQGSSDWKGVQTVIDMSIGSLLKDFAKSGRQPERIVRILTTEKLLPRSPYAHVELDFGKVRVRQQGNLWEMLAEIGEPARKALEEGSQDKDLEIAAEAKSALTNLKKP